MNVYRKAFAEHLEWLVTMAMTPGWWQHSRLRARELEADESRAFIGIRAAVRDELKRRVFQRAPRPVDAARAVEQGEPV